MELGQDVADTFFETAATVMIVLDTEGRLERINRRGCSVLGYDREAIIGEDWFDLAVPDHSEAGFEDVFGPLVDGPVDRIDVHENQIVTKDGTVRTIKWHNSPLFDDSGAVVGLLASGSDITERKAYERRLQRYKQAIECSTDMLDALDTDYNYLFANRAYREFHDISPERDLSSVTQEEVHGEAWTEEIKPYVERVQGGETVQYEMTRPNAAGEERTLDIRYYPLEDEAGSIVGNVAAMRDITERKERERSLRMFRKAVEHSGHGIMVTDTDGCIEYVNPAFESMTGYSKDEAIGKTPRILKSGAQRQAVYEELWDTILSGEVWKSEMVNRTKRGDPYVVEQTIAPVTNEDGDIDHFVAVNIDISERKEYERQLTRKNERLDEFASVISHDLRNPLTVAKGRATLLEAECESEHVELVLDALERMEEIVSRTFDLARKGETVGETEAIDLVGLLEHCWGMVNTKAASMTIDADCTIDGDRDRLRHLFENLIRNAIVHGGDAVSVRVGRFGTDGLYFEDDGAGISPDRRERVFDPGFSTSEEGSGFGLPMVERIAAGHGWSVTVTESDAGGARFEFTGVDFS